MRPLVVLSLCLLFTGCGNLQNLAAKAKAKQRQKELKKLTEASAGEASSRLGERAVGEIFSVNAASGYALLRARNGLNLPVGQELQTRGASPARLRVTPEKKDHVLYAVDIVSGVPEKGDAVVLVKSLNKPERKLVPVAAAPLTGSSAPANTLHLDASAIRPEDLPRTTLDEPGGVPPLPSGGFPEPDVSPASPPAPEADPGNLLTEPPLPEATEAPR